MLIIGVDPGLPARRPRGIGARAARRSDAPAAGRPLDAEERDAATGRTRYDEVLFRLSRLVLPAPGRANRALLRAELGGQNASRRSSARPRRRRARAGGQV